MKQISIRLLCVLLACWCGVAQSQTVINKAEYWLDKDFSSRSAISITGEQTVSLKSIALPAAVNEGIHTFNMRVQDSKGEWSVVQTQSFFKYPQLQEGAASEITGYEYWFDTNFEGRTNKAKAPDNLLYIDQVDVSACTEGVHTFNMRVKDKSGNWSVVHSQSFYKNATEQGGGIAAISAYEYWFDQDFEARTLQTASANSTFSLSGIDVSACTPGQHIFNFRVQDSNGLWSVVNAQNFYKYDVATTPDSKITGYRYWFDKDAAAPIKVEVAATTASELSAIVIPPGLTDGLKHTLHIQFCDNSGHWSVVESEEFTMPEPPMIHKADFDQLVAFYRTTGGEAWISTEKQYYTAWETDNSESKVYTWYGVVTREGRVSEINLPNNRLTGSLPGMEALTQLTRLDVQGNNIRTIGTALPATIATLNLENQLLDMGTISLPATGFEADLPNICLYHHAAQNFETTPLFELFIDDRLVGTVTASGGKIQFGKLLETAAPNSFITLLQKDGDAKGTQLGWRGNDMTQRQINLMDIAVADRVYDGSTKAHIERYGTLSGIAFGHEVSLDINGAIAEFSSALAATDIPVNISGMTLKGKHADLYTLAQPKDVKANILPKELMVTGMTTKEKVYDGTITATIDQEGVLQGVLDGDDVSLSILGATANYNDARAGNNRQATVTDLSLTGAQKACYTLTAQMAVGQISRATVNLSGLTIRDKEYDGTVTAYAGNTGVLTGVLENDNVTVGTVTAVYDRARAGEEKTVTVTDVNLAGNDAANYKLYEWPETLTAAVHPRVVTVSGMKIADKLYDGTANATIDQAGQLSWTAAGDDVALDISQAVANFADVSSGTRLVNISGVALNGEDAVSYTLQQPTGVTGVITRMTPEILAAPTARPIQQGQALRRSEFIGGQTSAPGRFVFDQPYHQPELGTLAHLAWFIPDDNNYERVSFQVEVMVIAKPYTIIASTDKAIYNTGEQAYITGKVTASGIQPVAGITVDVHVDMTGYRRTIPAKTDASGNFSVAFEPLNDEAGHYAVICNVRDDFSDAVQQEFDIIGMRLATTGWITWEVEQGKTHTGSISLRNRTGKDLKNITVEVLSGTSNAEIVFEPLAVLPGNKATNLNYTVKGLNPTGDTQWEEVQFKVTSAEGANCTFNTQFYCRAPKAVLEVLPERISTSMVRNVPKNIEIKLVNNGKGATGAVNVMIPQTNWMEIVSARTMPSMATNDTAVIVLRLNAGKNLVLGPYSGNITLNCANGANLSIPFDINAVSENTAKLTIDVVDDYYYNTAASPHLAGARVVLSDPFTGKTVAEGTTGANGHFVVEKIPEGHYNISVSATKHTAKKGTILVEAGKENYQQVYIRFNAIDYDFVVEPTEIEDQYDVELVMEYETNVPVPVVIMEMPETLPELVDCEPYTFMVRVTNKGLITARDVELEFPYDPEYQFTYSYGKFDLYANQVIEIPVVMECRSASEDSESLRANARSLRLNDTKEFCINIALILYWYECGPETNYVRIFGHKYLFAHRICFGFPWPNTPPDGDYDPLNPPVGPCFLCELGKYVPDITFPSITITNTGCKPCIEELIIARIGCMGPYGNAFACGYNWKKDGVTIRNTLGCGIGFTGFGCPYGILDALLCNWEVSITTRGSVQAQGKHVPKSLLQVYDDLQELGKGTDAFANWTYELLGDRNINSDTHIHDFVDAVGDYLDQGIVIPEQALPDLYVTGVGKSYVDFFVNRWNTSVIAWNQGVFAPNSIYPDIINKVVLDGNMVVIHAVAAYAESRGFDTVEDMWKYVDTSIQTFIDKKGGRMVQSRSGKPASVCASVTLQINQRVAMTREAFRGTLTLYNGHESIAMEDVKLALTVKDEYGIDCTDLFQINTEKLDVLTGIDGTGSLGAQLEGIASVLFIPERGAAPTKVKKYKFGGVLSYTDPFNGELVTIPLIAHELEVHPGPNLEMHYFMQRDILGDDALTEAIEPMVPAELAVLINNKGYGQAKNLTIASAQPEIIENRKGLLIDFKLIGSNLNGQPHQLGLTNINFGNIAPQSQTVGQWWMTSTLLGHFRSLEARFSHLNSQGNPELSLISDVKIHELTRSIKGYADPTAGITGFLVNDESDLADAPDAIWFADGTHTMVQPAVKSTVEGTLRHDNKTVTLWVEAKKAGWSYAKVDDPGKGRYKLVSVTRDGRQSIPLNNVWQTHCTLPDRGEPVYENKLHLTDSFATASLVKYTLEFEEADIQAGLYVLAFNNVPSEPVTQRIEKVEVVFNKPVDGATFTWHDLDLSLPDGKNLITSEVTISQKDDVTWEIDLSAVTKSSGLYTLTVHTEGISGTDTQYGQRPEQITWVQLLTGITTKTDHTMCDGEAYIFDGQALEKSGTYYQVTEAGGIEQIMQLDLVVLPAPQVSLGEDRVLDGLQAMIDAGAGFVSYQWHTGATEQILPVSGADGESVTVSVVVTNEHGCAASDEVSLTFAAKSCTITFDTQGGSTIEAVQVQENEKITQPADPVWNTYLFDGWFKEAACIHAWDFDTDVAEGNTVLYARWVEIRYTVTFDTQGGNTIDAMKVRVGDKASRPADPVRDNYTFDKWYKETTYISEWIFDMDVITEDVTLYAKWDKTTNSPDDIALHEALVYPNPVRSGKVYYIRLDSRINKPILVEVYNAAGALMSKTTFSEFPIRMEAGTPGTYIIRLIHGDQTANYKLVVE